VALSGRRVDWAWRSTCASACFGDLDASSNYVINEMLDAPFDRLHPTKKNRPSACGWFMPVGATRSGLR